MHFRLLILNEGFGRLRLFMNQTFISLSYTYAPWNLHNMATWFWRHWDSKKQKKEKERLPLRLWVGLIQSVEGLLSKLWEFPEKKEFSLKIATETSYLGFQPASQLYTLPAQTCNINFCLSFRLMACPADLGFASPQNHMSQLLKINLYLYIFLNPKKYSSCWIPSVVFFLENYLCFWLNEQMKQKISDKQNSKGLQLHICLPHLYQAVFTIPFTLFLDRLLCDCFL